MEIALWITGGFIIGYAIMKLALSLIDWAEKHGKK